MEVDDGKSSSTAVTTDSDDNASDTVTLVDVFSDLAVGDLFEVNDDNPTSAESSATPSSEVSTDNQSTPSADASGSEIDLKTSGKKGKVSDTDSDSGISADTSSAEAISSTDEPPSSQANSAEAAMARSTTSGETTSDESSTSGAASPAGGGVSSSAQSSDTGHWTPSEDALIISMKEGGESWASIGKAINRGKSEVKKRWHVVRANAANSVSGGDAQTNTESGGDNGQRESMVDSKTDQSHNDKRPKGHADDKLKSRAERKAERKAEQKKNRDNAKSDDQTKEPKKPQTKPKQRNPKAEEQQPSEASEAPSTPKPSSSNSVGDSPSSSLRNRLSLLRDTTSASSSTSSATSNDGEDGDDASDSPAKSYHRELVGQERYIRRHVNPALYPPLSHPLMPPPNAFRPPSHAEKRQRRDDKILASVLSRREATKWLEMQANFYNVTGRMVPLHMIKARCEAEEGRSKDLGVRNWATSVADGEELLDPSEGADVPEDALVEHDKE
ncbi:hypothetical protein LX32DRAFT_694014 [Colletotrichum zoysiae]|uniref:Myb-like domain-containing protein n=1 Tax=Colletotrichum zoysiae TaxID=1216348 RepID=A0AAD9HGM0_9PEZI|nr:hypothetical protein LX32DRAFT_694014 [Colletotrichum zoysiae]